MALALPHTPPTPRVDALALLDKFYGDNPGGRAILVGHGTQIFGLCEEINARHPELRLDMAFLREASLLHDVGMCKTNAPAICCFGDRPFIQHGVLGADMLRAEGLEQHARVCERHTGAGIDAELIAAGNLPLPADRVMMPETLEEKALCYADKFFSKGDLARRFTLEEARAKLAEHGATPVARFDALAALFR